MDRAAFDRNRNGKQEQNAYPMAMVHSLLLPRGGRQHLRSHLPARVSGAEASWRYRPDCHALPDWNWALHEDSPRSWRSTVPSGGSSLALRRAGIAFAHPWRLDSPLGATSIGATMRIGRATAAAFIVTRPNGWHLGDSPGIIRGSINELANSFMKA